MDNHGQLSLPIPKESLRTEREREHDEALRCLAPLMAFWAARWRADSPYRKDYAYWGGRAARLLERWS
jgi:hypothetical protein